MKTSIIRLDLESAKNGSYNALPRLSNVNEITDINEIESISFTFESEEEFTEFNSKFPKSYLGRRMNVNIISEGKTKPYLKFDFSKIFWTNDVTGDINESGIKRRENVVKRLKMLN